MGTRISEQDSPESLEGHSLDIAAEKRKQLQQLFPEAFTEGALDTATLRRVVGEDIVSADREHYGLSWAGKYEAFKEIQKQTTATLIPQREESIDFDSTGNIFIEGENLEVLRVLQKSYYGKVKMIYIDPPYNTGNDHFVYPDDFAERLDEYQRRTGIKDEEGFLNKQDLWKKNTRENGHFHSVWLSMMYPRLYLARNLLRDDGVIFVSIDDNEVANLRLLMDEVFGEENFVECYTWKKSYGGGAKEKYVVRQHEYCLMYAKNILRLDDLWLPPDQSSIERYYRYRDEQFDKRGPYRLKPLEATKSMDSRPNLIYPIMSPEGKEIWPQKQWWWSQERVREAIANKEIVFTTTKDRVTISYKQYLKDIDGRLRGVKPFSIIDSIYTQHGTEELRKIFNGALPLQFPKPTTLIKKLLQTGSTEDSVILDFFAGSGSTAHAVLDLNQEDGGNRKFICVQMPEPTDEGSEAQKAGYNTIADISRARIRKVIEKIGKENEGKLELETPGDLGFRSYRLAPSNFKAWRGTADNEELEEMLLEFQDAHKAGAEAENMVTELLLKAGLPLTSSVEKVTLGDTTFYNVDNGRMVVLLERIDNGIRDYLLERKPAHVVCLDTVFENNDQLLTNLGLQLKEAEIELTVI